VLTLACRAHLCSLRGGAGGGFDCSVRQLHRLHRSLGESFDQRIRGNRRAREVGSCHRVSAPHLFQRPSLYPARTSSLSSVRAVELSCRRRCHRLRASTTPPSRIRSQRWCPQSTSTPRECRGQLGCERYDRLLHPGLPLPRAADAPVVRRRQPALTSRLASQPVLFSAANWFSCTCIRSPLISLPIPHLARSL